MIEIKQLCKSFEKTEVLKNVNLSVNDGSVLGLVGINGAGKSTLLRLISGIYRPDQGMILIDGKNIFDNPEIKSKLFFLPDEPFFNLHSTPLALIDLYQHFYQFDKSIYLKYLEYFKLPINNSMHNYSKGMKRQVFISLAIAIQPQYLLLDEAFDGLDPIARLEVKKALVDLITLKNTTVIISSHSLRELEDICDSFALIDHQEIASSGDLVEKLNKYHKYIIAFNEEVSGGDFNMNFIQFEKENRIIKVIVEENLDTFTEKIMDLNPILIDEVTIDFEELFIIEVENRGYLK